MTQLFTFLIILLFFFFFGGGCNYEYMIEDVSNLQTLVHIPADAVATISETEDFDFILFCTDPEKWQNNQLVECDHSREEKFIIYQELDHD